MSELAATDIVQIEKDEIDFNQFWAITCEGLCWQIVLRNLVKNVPEGSNNFLMGVAANGTMVWYLNKKAFPADMLGPRIKTDPAKLTDKIHKIHLTALEKAERPDQPRPTVPYFGEA